MKSDQPIKIKIINKIYLLSQLTLYYATRPTIAEHWNRDTMKFHFCAKQFLKLPFPFPNFKKSFFDSFQIFQIRSHREGEGKCRVLVMEIQR